MTTTPTTTDGLIALAPVIAVLVVIVGFALLAIYGMPRRSDLFGPWRDREPGDLGERGRP